jgi:hypothetical protein
VQVTKGSRGYGRITTKDKEIKCKSEYAWYWYEHGTGGQETPITERSNATKATTDGTIVSGDKPGI